MSGKQKTFLAEKQTKNLLADSAAVSISNYHTEASESSKKIALQQVQGVRAKPLQAQGSGLVVALKAMLPCWLILQGKRSRVELGAAAQ